MTDSDLQSLKIVQCRETHEYEVNKFDEFVETREGVATHSPVEES